MYEYEYFENEFGNMQLNILVPERGPVVMGLDPNDAVHAELIDLLKEEFRLIRYVDYLASDPDRIFDLDEIKNVLLN